MLSKKSFLNTLLIGHLRTQVHWPPRGISRNFRLTLLCGLTAWNYPSSLILHVAAKESKGDKSEKQEVKEEAKKEVKEEVIEAAVTKEGSSKTGENVANPAHTEKLDQAANEAESKGTLLILVTHKKNGGKSCQTNEINFLCNNVTLNILYSY